jgi:hypothetical protein
VKRPVSRFHETFYTVIHRKHKAKKAKKPLCLLNEQQLCRFPAQRIFCDGDFAGAAVRCRERAADKIGALPRAGLRVPCGKAG